MLRRDVSGICGQTLIIIIIELHSSPKAVKENLDVLEDGISQAA